MFLLSIIAPEIGFDHWSWSIGINEYPGSYSLEYKTASALGPIRFIEFMISFVLFGYIAAETKGRRVISFGRALLNVLFISTCTALVCETVRGFHSQLAFSIAEWVVAVIAGCYGGCLYLTILKGITGPGPVSAQCTKT